MFVSVRYACRDYDQYLASLSPSLRSVSLEGASVFVPSFRIRRPLPPGATLRIAATHVGCRSRFGLSSVRKGLTVRLKVLH